MVRRGGVVVGSAGSVGGDPGCVEWAGAGRCYQQEV